MSRPPSQLDVGGGAPVQIRRRLTGVLFSGVAISRTGYIVAITMTTLVAKDMLGSATLAGLPGAISVLGTAVGGARLSSLMDRIGRRRGLSVGYGILAVGAAGAATARQRASRKIRVIGRIAVGDPMLPARNSCTPVSGHKNLWYKVAKPSRHKIYLFRSVATKQVRRQRREPAGSGKPYQAAARKSDLAPAPWS